MNDWFPTPLNISFIAIQLDTDFSSSRTNTTDRMDTEMGVVTKIRRKAKKARGNATHASVKKEMAKPRTAKSARIAELNLNTRRIPEQPSTTVPGTVDKIIASPRPSQPEKAEIAVDGADFRHRDHFRIENTLTDEHGDDAKLKKGAHVEVTVTAEPKTLLRTRDRGSRQR